MTTAKAPGRRGDELRERAAILSFRSSPFLLARRRRRRSAGRRRERGRLAHDRVERADADRRAAAGARPEVSTYQGELTAIKNAQSRLTKAQRQGDRLLGGGGVMRWNQIHDGAGRALGLPPAAERGRKVSMPDANTVRRPLFPFTNPLYAARAYSYVCVAQFEALKSAWY